jgi:hypothetical protein
LPSQSHPWSSDWELPFGKYSAGDHLLLLCGVQSVGSNPGSLSCYQNNDYNHWHMINNMKAACQEPSSKDLTSTTQSKDLAEFTYKGHHIARLQKISSLL